VKWLILAIFLGGMFSSLQWYEAVTREQKMAFGLMTAAAFVLVVVLGNTIL
jgi:prepilin signal peptidase PulO-like enzyme (type II secretory pathway)